MTLILADTNSKPVGVVCCDITFICNLDSQLHVHFFWAEPFVCGIGGLDGVGMLKPGGSFREKGKKRVSLVV